MFIFQNIFPVELKNFRSYIFNYASVLIFFFLNIN